MVEMGRDAECVTLRCAFASGREGCLSRCLVMAFEGLAFLEITKVISNTTIKGLQRIVPHRKINSGSSVL